MEGQFIEIDVTATSKDYIRECLSDGCPLGAGALAQIESLSGRVVSYVPDDEPPEYTYRVKWGYYMDLRPPSDWIARRMQKYLSTEEYGSVIFRIEYAWVERLGEDDFFATRLFGSPLFAASPRYAYARFLFGDTGEDSIRTAMARSDGGASAAFSTFLIHSRDATEADCDASLGDVIVREMKEGLRAVILGAYDGEGYIIWERS